MNTKMKLVIGHLYPTQMNLYGDRGNISCLLQRCRWRGIEAEVKPLDLNEPLDPEGYDLLFMGGGQDREQQLVAADLANTKGEALRQAVANGVVALAICGGYQLFGHYYRPAQGPELPGIGIFDAWTVHPGKAAQRCIGNIVIEWEKGILVGFENHGGRTYLGPKARPLGRVLAGYGNNTGNDEGAIQGTAFGSYLHGSFLPKNPEFADHLIALALQRRYGEVELAPLDDSLELAAKNVAARQALAEGRWQRRRKALSKALSRLMRKNNDHHPPSKWGNGATRPALNKGQMCYN